MNHKFKQWWYALHSGKPIKILFFIQKALKFKDLFVILY